jgi:hypothetical protein
MTQDQPSIKSTKEQVDELIQQNRMILEFNLKALTLLTSAVYYVNAMPTKGETNSKSS